MKSKLIVMLTHNDQTVHDANKIFEECHDLPVDYWGVKNIGIPESQMIELITMMKNANKKTVLEVVTYTEESCMSAAKFACEHNFDYLLGTCYYDSIWNYLKGQSIQYYPFVGNVSGNPSLLSGSPESIVSAANELYKKNIPGIDILAYRYIDGDPVFLAQNIIKQVKSNVIVAGSIDRIERIKIINSINPWGFTIGSALYTCNFLKGAGYRANLEKVLDIINILQNY